MEIISYNLWDKVGKIANNLPEVYEKLCHDTPAWYTGKNFFVRLKEDAQTIALYNHNRDDLVASDPDTFFITDHYLAYPIILVDLAIVSQADLRSLVINSWKIRTSKKLLKAYNAVSG